MSITLSTLYQVEYSLSTTMYCNNVLFQGITLMSSSGNLLPSHMPDTKDESVLPVLRYQEHLTETPKY